MGKHKASPTANALLARAFASLSDGRLDEALALGLDATRRSPSLPAAWKLLGVAQSQSGRLNEAERSLSRAHELDPSDPQTLNSLGNVLRQFKRLAQAKALLQKALARAPQMAEAHNNLGLVLHAQGEYPESIACYERAIALKPAFAAAFHNLAWARKDLGDFSGAEEAARRAIAIDPSDSASHDILGSILYKRKRLSDAAASYRKALELDPANEQALGNWASFQRDCGLIDAAETTYRKVLTQPANTPGIELAYDNLLFALNYHPTRSAEDIFEDYRAYDDRFCRPNRPQVLPNATPLNGRRLRVGYVSPDFRSHSVAMFLMPLIAGHDRTQVELYAYAELVREDANTQRFKAHFDHWIPTRGLNDDELAQRVREDGIDVLVDVAGHTAGHRLQTFARKPAPVSVSWMGYGYTTGLTAIDWYLTTATVAPEGSENLFSEGIWRLPGAPFVYTPSPGMGDVSPLPAAQRGYVTFVCLSRAIRINERVIALWARLLARLPRARLVMDSDLMAAPEVWHRLALRFHAHGIEPERLQFGFHSPPWDVLRDADIALDCFPHNSGTTLIESLYMGVPFVTLADRPSVGRLGAAINEGVALEAWTAHSEDDYLEIACRWAGDLPGLAALRADLRRRLEASKLMDGARFARDVEAAYHTMHSRAVNRAAGSDESHRQGSDSDGAETFVMVPPADAQRALVMLFQAGQPQQLEAAARQVVARFPKHPLAWSALGVALAQQERYVDAEAPLRRALTLEPENDDALNALAVVLRMIRRPAEAEPLFRRVLARQPNHLETVTNFAAFLGQLGQFEEELKLYRHALTLDGPPKVKLMAFDGLLFLLNYHPSLSAEEIFEVYREFDRRFGSPVKPASRPRAAPSSGRRLRVGYVSPDFRSHSVSRFLMPLLAAHDRRDVELFAYAEIARPDAHSERYRALVDHWLVTWGMSTEDLAQRIRSDCIDVLVDVAGHTENHRLLVFAHQPAPVSVSWLGYGYTTGLSAIDWFLTDATTVPKGAEHLFSERPWRLERLPFVYEPSPAMGPVSALPALRNGHVRFACLSRAIRINDRVIQVWARLLHALPEATLVLDSELMATAFMQDRIVQGFASHGIDRDRLELGFHTPPWNVLRGVDITLDCFPHNSGTTLVESLYMGVPFVTLADRPSVGRLGASINHAVGLDALTANSVEDYLSTAIALATNLTQLSALRAELRDRVEKSQIMDTHGLAREMEAAFFSMHRMAMSPVPNIDRPVDSSDPLGAGDAAALDGDFSSAIERYRLALPMASSPVQRASIHVRIARASLDSGNRQGALAEALLAVAADSQCGAAHSLIGRILLDSGQIALALQSHQMAIRSSPENLQAQIQMAAALGQVGALDQCVQAFDILVKKGGDSFDERLAFSSMLFAVNYHPTLHQTEIADRYREFDRRFCASLLRMRPAKHRLDSGQRLRVGLVSPDFRGHAVAKFVMPLLAGLRERRVEVFAYAELLSADQTTERLKAVVGHWIPTRGLTDDALASRIQADEIDVLVDLAGHTADNRLLVFARKPAPVQVTWLGYGYTTGLSAIDYILTDEIHAPAGSEALFSEKPWRLGRVPYVYQPDEGMGEVGPLPAHSRGYVTFGCLSRAIRINDRVIGTWARLLKELPTARLVLNSALMGAPEMQQRIRGKFEALGVEGRRIELGYDSPPWDVLRGIDITLDCFPHNSGTTLIESLYMGVPVITKVDRPSVGRLGASINHALGLEHLTASTEDKYIEIAKALAGDVPKLAALRASLRTRMEQSPLMDAQGFARAVEEAFLQMVQRAAAENCSA